MSITDTAAFAAWGFLVGFVGWGGSLRLPQAVAAWLIQSRHTNLATGIARLLVALFLILTILLTLTLLPVVIIVARTGDNPSVNPIVWRSAFSVTFVSSLLGLFAFGIVRRLAR